VDHYVISGKVQYFHHRKYRISGLKSYRMTMFSVHNNAPNLSQYNSSSSSNKNKHIVRILWFIRKFHLRSCKMDVGEILIAKPERKNHLVDLVLDGRRILL